MGYISTSLSNPSDTERFEVSLVIDQNKERWRELCEQVEVEQDGKKLVELTTEIYRLLEEKKKREDAFRENVLWMPRHHSWRERMSQLKASS